MSAYLMLRSRTARQVLKALRVNSATGPDGLSARILQMCEAVLHVPFVKLARKIVSDRRWPDCWRLHWVVPLYKKKAVYSPSNYRGVHITAQISKAMERLLGKLFVPFLDTSGAYGLSQSAYRRERGSRAVLALNVMTWLLAMENGMKVALYCSDVSGAFDRVASERLVAKLVAKGMRPQMVRVLTSSLGARPLMRRIFSIWSFGGPCGDRSCGTASSRTRGGLWRILASPRWCTQTT